MDVQKFFDRIGFSGEAKADCNTLAQLQEHFLISVPFENLDIHYGPKEITVYPEASYDKIVMRGRGGFCHECNSLAYIMLKEIGFQVDVLSSRTLNENTPNPEFCHMTLRVLVDNQSYLVDMGNGRCFRTPLRIDGSNEASTPEGYTYRVGPHIEGNAVYVRSAEDGWTPRYFFSTTPRQFFQFEEQCRLCQTDPASPFVKAPLVTLATKRGRKILSQKVYIHFIGGEEHRRNIHNEQEFIHILATEFDYPVSDLGATAVRDYWSDDEANPTGTIAI